MRQGAKMTRAAAGHFRIVDSKRKEGFFRFLYVILLFLYFSVWSEECGVSLRNCTVRSFARILKDYFFCEDFSRFAMIFLGITF